MTVAFRTMGAVSGAKSALWPWLGVLASLSVTLTVYILVRALRPGGSYRLMEEIRHQLITRFHTSQAVQDF